jgi:hypothetical protein
MTPTKRYWDCRECAVQGGDLLFLASTDPQTVLEAVQDLLGAESATAHLYRDDLGWGVCLGLREERDPRDLEATLARVPHRTGHRLHVTVEEAGTRKVLFDHVYHPSGEMSEPIPG